MDGWVGGWVGGWVDVILHFILLTLMSHCLLSQEPIQPTRQTPIITEFQQVPDANPQSPADISQHTVPSTNKLSPMIFSRAPTGLEHGTSVKYPDYIGRGVSGDGASVLCPDNNFEVPVSPKTKCDGSSERRPLRCQPFEDNMTHDLFVETRKPWDTGIHKFSIDDNLDDTEFLDHQYNDDKDFQGDYSDVDNYMSSWMKVEQKYDNCPVMSPNEVTNDDTLTRPPWTQRNFDKSRVSPCQLSRDCSPGVTSSCHRYISDTPFVSAHDQITADVTQATSHDSRQFMSSFQSDDRSCEQSCHLSPGENDLPPRLENEDHNTRWGKFVDAESKPNPSVSHYRSRFAPYRHHDVKVGDSHSYLNSPLVSSESSSNDMKVPCHDNQLLRGTMLKCDSIARDRTPPIQPEDRHQPVRRTGAMAGFKPPAVVGREVERRLTHRRNATPEGSPFVQLTRTVPMVRNNFS